MRLDAYVKTAIAVIAMALAVIATNVWADHQALQGQMPSTDVSQMAARLAALEQIQKEQAQRIETLRAALQSTVLDATRRGYFPDRTWSTVKWDPDVPPAGGN